MSAVRRISPASRARRALLVDVVLAAVIALLALGLTAGFGVIAFFGVPLMLLGLAWIGLERLVSRIRRRRAG